MYEIWLALNIVWEIARGLWPWIAAAALLWVVAMALAVRRPHGRWRATLPGALAAGLAVGLLAFLGIPSALQSSLSELGYWVDWANLLAMAAAAAAVGVAFAWPVLRWTRG